MDEELGCSVCGASVHHRPFGPESAWTTYCSTECLAAAQQQSATERYCAHCGTPFLTTSPNRRHCSTRCVIGAHRHLRHDWDRPVGPDG